MQSLLLIGTWHFWRLHGWQCCDTQPMHCAFCHSLLLQHEPDVLPCCHRLCPYMQKPTLSAALMRARSRDKPYVKSSCTCRAGQETKYMRQHRHQKCWST